MYETHTTRQRLFLLFKILVPILIYQLANFSAQFIDTVMTGQYHELHLAGVSIASSLYYPFFTLLNGIVAAIIPIVGQLVGRKETQKIQQIVTQFLYIGVVLAFLLWIIGLVGLKPALSWMQLDPAVARIAVAYLGWLSIGFVPFLLFSVIRSFMDALGLTRISMSLMLLLVPLNMFFNYSLIYGQFGFQEMGGPGAGLGTALAYWVLLLITILVLKKHPRLKNYAILTLDKPLIALWKEPFMLGLPIGFSVFAEVAVFAFVGLLMSRFGADVIAAHQAAMNFSYLAYAFPMSISNALTIMVAYEIGKKHVSAAKEYIKIGLATSIGIALLTLILLYFNRARVAELYGHAPSFVSLTTTFLSYSLLFQLFDAIAAPIQGILRGYKDAKMPFILCLLGYWFIGMPIGFGMDWLTELGPFSYWIALIVGLMANCMLLVFRLRSVQHKYLNYDTKKERTTWKINH